LKNNKKNFILDTSVLVYHEDSIHAFPNQNVIIPMEVLEEVDNLKMRHDAVGNAARYINRFLDELRQHGSLKDGVTLENGETISVYVESEYDELPSSMLDTNDNKIIAVALKMSKKLKNVVLISRDINVRVKCDSLGIASENYHKEKAVISRKGAYTGVTVKQFEPADIQEFYDLGGIDYNGGDLFTNEFLVLKGGAQSALGMFRNGRIKPLAFNKRNNLVQGITPRNKEQSFALESLLDPNIHLATLSGIAGSGKAQPLDSKILTPTGWTTMGEVQIGSKVIGKDGRSANVIGVYPQGIKDIYRIKFSDGTSTRACGEHLWHTRTQLDRDTKRGGSIKSTYEMMESLRSGKCSKKNHSIPIVSPVEFRSPGPLPMHPYLLGSLLGDGGMSVGNPVFSSEDEESVEILAEMLFAIDCDIKKIPNSSCDYRITGFLDASCGGAISRRLRSTNIFTGDIDIYESPKYIKEKSDLCYSSISRAISKENRVYRDCEWEYLDKNKQSNNPLKSLLMQEGLWGCRSGDKFIPDRYKFTSVENRISLLRGLMDTDGTVSKSGHQPTFCSTSKALAEDTAFLVRSLGGKATISSRYTTYTHKNEKKIGKQSYRVRISLKEGYNPFLLKRKADRWIPNKLVNLRKYVDSIEFEEKTYAQCIMIDSEDHLYVTDDCIVTHNTLLATAAAVHMLNEGVYEKIVISRPIQSLSGEMGFLPGPQPLDAKVLTPSGWTTMGEVKVGSSVISRNGVATKVLGTYPKGTKDIYKITTRDGRTTECCEDHLWFTRTAEDKKRGRPGGVKATRDIINSLYTAGGKINHFLPRNEPIQFEPKELPLPPYLLGALIGDGSLSDSISFFNVDKEVIERVRLETESLGCSLVRSGETIQYNLRGNERNKKPAQPIRITNIKTGDITEYSRVGIASEDMGIDKGTLRSRCNSVHPHNGMSYEFLEKKNRWQNPIKEELHNLGILFQGSKNKSIPSIYLYNSSIEDRISLLRGLMDTDGTIKKNGETVFYTTSKQLKDDITTLVRSLGGNVTARERDREKEESKMLAGRAIKSGKIFDCQISLLNNINPFFLKRKAERRNTKFIYDICISSIEYIGKKEAKCIMIDNPEHLYVTDDFIVTHNTKYEKMEPWIQPIIDNLKFIFKNGETYFQMMMEKGQLEVEALSFIRGRSLPNTIFILDEAQNITYTEAKAVITRMGDNSKLVMLGDLEQIDAPHLDAATCGLGAIVERFKDFHLASHITLLKGERSPLAAYAATIL